MKSNKKALASTLTDSIKATLSQQGEPSKKVTKAVEKTAEKLAKKLTKLQKKEEEKAKEKSQKAQKKADIKAKKAAKKEEKRAEKTQKKSKQAPVLNAPAPQETSSILSPTGEPVSATAGRPTARPRKASTTQTEVELPADSQAAANS